MPDHHTVSLHAAQEDGRRLDLADCLRVACELAAALADIHAAQLIHRDIRPANILLARARDGLHLVDLGLAASVDSAGPGDWAYVSPEQTGRMNRAVDYRSDFYALGMTLYRMLTGQLPFHGNDPLEWTHCHIARSAPPPASVAPDIPVAVSAIVMKLLAKLPEERYQSARGLLADLERALAQWQAEGRIDDFAPGADDISERFQIPHNLYGRDRERTMLLDTFGQVAASGKAAMVTVSGYSGIGKSSLVHELHEPIVRAHGYFIAGKFDQFMRDIPYATLTQAFRDLVQQLLAESEERIVDWRARMQDAVGANGQLIVDVVPQVELIIGRQAPVPALPAAEAQHRFRQVFQRFMAVFTQQQHPLALFLDDMQWADAASLQFLEHLLCHPDTGSILLIAAYRDNEVGAGHPLTQACEAVRAYGTAVVDIRLAPLPVPALNRLVADTLHVPPAACEALTEVVFERTEGNPFFFTQFLSALHKEGVLRLDPRRRTWRWDVAQVRKRDFAENVAELMAARLRRLPPPVQDVLQLAACLGNKFDLHQLALVSALAAETLDQRLAAAAREDLIVLAGDEGKFLHDRIQQAAYALIPAPERAGVHLRIARILLARLDASEIDTQLFDLANQFNQGSALLTDAEEKARIAALNLRAAQKAKASVAYASACIYLAAGMALCGEQDWDRRHALMFDLWCERADCEFLSGKLDLAEALIATLLAHAVSTAEQVAAYSQKSRLHIMRSECEQAVDSALAGLRLSGFDLPAHPTWDLVEADYEQIWRQLGERPIEGLANLPRLSDPALQAGFDMLSSLIAGAAFSDMTLFCLVICRITLLSLQHGISNRSPFPFAVFGFLLSTVFHRYADGYRFAKLGRALADQRDDCGDKAQVYLTTTFNFIWTQPLADVLDFLRSIFHVGRETGDLFTACNNWLLLIAIELLQGVPLDAVWRDTEKAMAFARTTKYQDDVDVITCQQGFIATLQGRAAGAFDDPTFEEKLRVGQTAQPYARYLLFKLQARFLTGDLAAAMTAMQALREQVWALMNMPDLVLDYHFYAALILAGEASGGQRALLDAHLAQLREWAENCSPTFADRHALVAAEVARLDGRDSDAMRLYEQAIELAHSGGFVQCQGVAHETAARFYLDRGAATAAIAHLCQARSCFGQWGAGAKVRQLEARYPLLRAQPAANVTDSGMAQLDALSVAKASQAISSPIVLDELIDMLMRIVLENAGAQTAALWFERDEELVLVAEAGVTAQATQVRRYLDRPQAASSAPETVLNYVRRSHCPVSLPDPAVAHPFSADPYLASHRPKSVLCVPILRQDKLIGLLYLENTLLTHAFTPQRLTVLELLASQAAISLENALLYADLQQENSERKRMEAALREREARIRRLVESNIIGIFFWTVQGDVSDANDAFLSLIGQSRAALCAGALRWSDFHPPERAQADARAMEELTRTGKLPAYETEFVRKDGTRIPVLIGSALLEGSKDHGVGFVLDLTERRQAEAERTARQAADAANRAKSTFLANMSHELRTPLNGILGYTQILQRNPLNDDSQAAALKVIRQSGEHLLNLINDILDFVKVEASKLTLYEGPVRLGELLDGVTEMVAVRASQKDLEFICDIDPGLPEAIQTDEKRLRQILLNLLANAIKFTDRGQVSLRVRALAPARLRFEVRDTGIGIGEKELTTIFEPFEQAGDMQRRMGGAGLGLAISREFLRLMGSEIRVESRVGAGSTFWFELDVEVVDALGAPVVNAVTSGYLGPRRTVLVVDDVRENRTMLSDMLAPLGFTIGEAADGAAGLAQAQALRPDLIMMDVVMPVMDGLEAMRRLRHLPEVGAVPVIAVSASASGSDAATSLAAGANCFLAKPVKLEQLLAQIGALLKLEWQVEAGAAPKAGALKGERPLVVPPAQEMAILHHLARLGNMQDIVHRATYLAALDERYRPFADQLSGMARGYRSKAVLSFVTHCMAHGGA